METKDNEIFEMPGGKKISTFRRESMTSYRIQGYEWRVRNHFRT